MAKKPITKAIWKTLMRRWTVVSILGFILVFFTFSRMHGVAPEHVPFSLVVASALGALMALGGLFGFALAFIFHLIHKNR